ncbi:hypothetical protein DFH27DRAFT_522979 [Peziza echinospora]|nr:hypothetical protein DFH27DRAFT_522979 [Peziza echinospora]
MASGSGSPPHPHTLSLVSEWPWERLISIIQMVKPTYSRYLGDLDFLATNNDNSKSEFEQAYMEDVMEQVVVFLYSMGMTRGQVVECVRAIDRVLMVEGRREGADPEDAQLGAELEKILTTEVGGGATSSKGDGTGLGRLSAVATAVPEPEKAVDYVPRPDIDINSEGGGTALDQATNPAPNIPIPISSGHIIILKDGEDPETSKGSGQLENLGDDDDIDSSDSDTESSFEDEVAVGSTAPLPPPRAQTPTNLDIDMPPTPVLKGQHTIPVLPSKSRNASCVNVDFDGAGEQLARDEIADSLFRVEGWHEGMDAGSGGGGGVPEVISMLNLYTLSKESVDCPEVPRTEGPGEDVETNQTGLIMRGKDSGVGVEQDDDSTSEDGDDEDEEVGLDKPVHPLSRNDEEEIGDVCPSPKSKPTDGDDVPLPETTAAESVKLTTPPLNDDGEILGNEDKEAAAGLGQNEHREKEVSSSSSTPQLTIITPPSTEYTSRNAPALPRGPIERIVLEKKFLDKYHAPESVRPCGPLSVEDVDTIARWVMWCFVSL